MVSQTRGKDGVRTGCIAAFRRLKVLTIVATLVVLVAVMLPGDDVPDFDLPGLDKVVHAILFGCWALALRFDWDRLRARPLLLMAAVAVLGPLTEAMQLFSPGRSFELLDIAADLAGAALATAFGAPAVLLAERLLGGRPSGTPDRGVGD
jgi:hypothetical protein